MGRVEPPDDAQMRAFTSRVLVVLGLVTLLALLWLFVWYAMYLLLLVFAGVLVAVLLRAISEPLARLTGLPDGVAVVLVGLAMGGATVGAVAALSGPVATQVEQLQRQLPNAVESVREAIDAQTWSRDVARALPAGPGEISGDFVDRFTGVISSAMEGVAYTFIVLFIGVYLAIQPTLYVEGAVRLLPVDRRPRAREVLASLGRTLRWWLLGRLISMAAVGVLTALGLWLLDVPLWLTFGILAGLLDFIPNIGPVLAAVPALLISFLDGPDKVLWVLLLYTVVQQIESLLITPVVQQRAVHLPPGLTIFAQVLMGILAGVLGLAMATPLAAVLLVVVQMVYREDILGDPVVSRGGLDDEASAAREPSDEDPGPPISI